MATQVVILSTPGTSTTTVPVNAVSAVFEAWGGGAGAYKGQVGTFFDIGGSGGGYGKSNPTLVTPGAVFAYSVGAAAPGATANNTAGTQGGDSWIATNNTATVITSPGVVAGGKGGFSTSTGFGGSANGVSAAPAATASVGAAVRHKGGDGRSNGGGGAGGPNGDGANGGINSGSSGATIVGAGGGGADGGTAGSSTASGGGGGNGPLGTGGGAGATGTNANGTSGTAGTGGGGGAGTGSGNGGNGASGTEDVSVGSGGGGGGSGATSGGTTATGGNGGLYGGGGGSGFVGDHQGAGAQGLVVITYTLAPTGSQPFFAA